jgi:hypothetical protein
MRYAKGASQKLTMISFEYSSRMKEFVVFMTTEIHDTFAGRLAELLILKLKGSERVWANSSLEQAVQRLGYSTGSRKKMLKSKKSRGADGSFSHEDCKQALKRGHNVQAALAIEVNWTHCKTPEHFKERAEELICGVQTPMRTVINVDLGDIYRTGARDGVKTGGPAPALVSVYRARTATNDGESTVIAVADPKEMVCHTFLPSI